MTATPIRDALNARPFRPFVVRVADQRSFDVPHPEFASVGPKGQTLFIWREDEGFRIVDMLTITGIDFETQRSGGSASR
jgi:hypothetical protein